MSISNVKFDSGMTALSDKSQLSLTDNFMVKKQSMANPKKVSLQVLYDFIKSKFGPVPDPSLPIGAIIQWDLKNFPNIPTDWHLCDGSTVEGYGKVPDRRKVYTAGYDPDSPKTPVNATDLSDNYGAAENTFGSNSVTLSASESGMPAHVVKVKGRSRKDDGNFSATDALEGADKDVNAGWNFDLDINVEAKNAIQAHENRPSSIVGCYIVKISNTQESTPVVNYGSVIDALGYTPYDNANPLKFITAEDIPTTLPASDVYLWAKQPTKPTYSYTEVGAAPADTVSFPGFGLTHNLAAYGDHTHEGKQDALYGNGLVRMNGSVLTYDDNAYLTGISGAQVTNALGYTPYNASNPAGYITASAIPEALKNPYALTIKQDEFNSKTYNGSLAITIDYASIGAAPTNHTHTGYEAYLNAPPVSGYVLSSTTTGARSWIAVTNQVQPDWNATSGLGAILNKPTSLPASDVYAWAKAATKPSYTWSEIGSRPTALSAFTNDLGNYGGFVTGTPWTSMGYLTGITSGQVTNALGYTPSKSSFLGQANIDNYLGDGFFEFDPIPTGTPPLQSPNIRVLSIGAASRNTQLAFNYATDQAFFRRNTDGVWSSWKEFYHTGNFTPSDYQLASTAINTSNIGNQTVNRAEYVANESAYMRFHWSGQGGQPTWLWGSSDAANMYVYNPSNFSVNYATTAGSAGNSTSLGGNVAANFVQGINGNRTTSDSDFNAYKPSGFYDYPAANGAPTATWYHMINCAHDNSSAGNLYQFQIAAGFLDKNNFFMRSISPDSVGAWKTLWHDGNFTPSNYALTSHTHDYATHRGEGTNYIDYSRYVYNNGAYSGSGWVEPSDLGVRYANSANFLSTNYVGAAQSNPQVYFNNTIGLKVAMTAFPTVWADTLWINGYAGGDVPSMCALHFLRNSEPRMFISSQASTATSYGTTYEVISAYNIANQSVNYAASAGNASTLGGSSLTTILNNAGNSGEITSGAGVTAISQLNFGSAKYIQVKGYTSVTAYGSFVASGTATVFKFYLNMPSTVNTVAGFFVSRYSTLAVAMGTVSVYSSTQVALTITFAAGQAPPSGSTAIWSVNLIYS